MTYICAYFLAFFIVYSLVDILANCDVIQEGL